MTEDRRDEDEFEKLLRESIDAKGTGRATDNASWEGQEDVYTPSAHRPADATGSRQRKGAEQPGGDQEWDRNIGDAVYAIRNQQVAEHGASAPDSESSSLAQDEAGAEVEAPRASPEQPDGPRSMPSQPGRRANWGLGIGAVAAVIALATWLALRDQQGFSRLSGVEQRLDSLQQQVAGGTQDVANRERMENRLLDLETAMAELSLGASSLQTSEASMSPTEDAELQRQLSEQGVQLEAFEKRVAALEEGVSSVRKMLAERSKVKVQPNSGGNVPKAGKVAAGGWVINLITVTRTDHAARLLAKYRKKGVEAEQLEIKRDGKRLYRLRLGGFSTRAEAQGYADEVQSKLGLKETWITRR